MSNHACHPTGRYKSYLEVDFAAGAAKRSLVLVSNFVKSTSVEFLAANDRRMHKQLLDVVATAPPQAAIFTFC